jgi:hypothetical protein
LKIENPIAFKYSEFACIVDFLVEKFGKNKFDIYMKSLFLNQNEIAFKNVYNIDFTDFINDFLKMANK